MSLIFFNSWNHFYHNKSKNYRGTKVKNLLEQKMLKFRKINWTSATKFSKMVSKYLYYIRYNSNHREKKTSQPKLILKNQILTNCLTFKSVSFFLVWLHSLRELSTSYHHPKHFPFNSEMKTGYFSLFMVK